MNIKNLHFFDKNGYELNLNYNIIRKCWEGNIHLPKTSVGLYSNTTIYIMEEVDVPTKKGKYVKHLKSTDYEKKFLFPRMEEDGPDKITCQWDLLNNFVDEFFMFVFDEDYVPSKMSSLEFIPNDGPECKTVCINRFDTYEINLDNKDITDNRCQRVLPIHVGFSAPVHHDATTYKRTLVLYYGQSEFARISFYAETIEEDERLKIWNYNLGYNISPEDTLIFKKSDINEPAPDYKLLNEKRKELMIEGHNIYPYIGSYKALINVIKFFGYDNLNIIEFWKNKNPNSNEFGELKIIPKYILKDNDCVYVQDKYIDFPNRNYKKTNKLALSYRINTPIESVNLYELPNVKEDFEYSIEEIMVKLLALKKKLNKEFLPSSSRIIDIMGEASYFGIQLIKNGYDGIHEYKVNKDEIEMSIRCFPTNTVYISSDKFFNDFVFEYYQEDKNENIEGLTILDNIKETTLDELFFTEMKWKKPLTDVNKFNSSEAEKCDIYKKYYNLLNYYLTKSEDLVDHDLYTPKNPKYTHLSSSSNTDIVTKLGTDSSAKVILSNATFTDKTWNDLSYPFKYIGQTFNDTRTINSFQYSLNNGADGITSKTYKTYLKWTVRLSGNQLNRSYDESKRTDYYTTISNRYLKYGNIRLKEVLDNHAHLNDVGTNLIPDEFVYDGDESLYIDSRDSKFDFKAIKFGDIEEMNDVLFELPYVGYYDVTVDLYKILEGDTSTLTNEDVLKIIDDYNESISNSSETDFTKFVDNNYFNSVTTYMNNGGIVVSVNLDKDEFMDYDEPNLEYCKIIYYTYENGFETEHVYDCPIDGLNITVKIDNIDSIKFDFKIKVKNTYKTIETDVLHYTNIVVNSKTFEKFIKVEPYNIDIRGFYYDSRDINIDDYTKYSYVDKNLEYSPTNRDYVEQKDMEDYIMKSLDLLTFVAKHDNKTSLRKHEPGGYDLQMVMNRHLNKYKNGLYNINDGPYNKRNFNIEDYIIQDGVMTIDNVNPDIVNLIPTLKTARYIRNGVDVKPYTWIFLTFDYSKIVHRCNPVWTLTNQVTNKKIKYYGKYFTCLLHDVGFYDIKLDLNDEFGNEYHVNRNIVVVDEQANDSLYTPFKIDYENFKELEEYRSGIRIQALYDLGKEYEDESYNMFQPQNMIFIDKDSTTLEDLNDPDKNNNDVFDGRLTLRPGCSAGWFYDYINNISIYDKMHVNLTRAPQPDDELYIYIIENPDSYYRQRIYGEDTTIYLNNLDIDLSNITYVLFHNASEDEDNRIDLELGYISCDIKDNVDWKVVNIENNFN